MDYTPERGLSQSAAHEQTEAARTFSQVVGLAERCELRQLAVRASGARPSSGAARWNVKNAWPIRWSQTCGRCCGRGRPRSGSVVYPAVLPAGLHRGQQRRRRPPIGAISHVIGQKGPVAGGEIGGVLHRVAAVRDDVLDKNSEVNVHFIKETMRKTCASEFGWCAAFSHS